jgi:hypothetical protein
MAVEAVVKRAISVRVEKRFASAADFQEGFTLALYSEKEQETGSPLPSLQDIRQAELMSSSNPMNVKPKNRESGRSVQASFSDFVPFIWIGFGVILLLIVLLKFVA